MNHKYLLLIFSLLASHLLSAQADFQYNFYQQNPVLLNPATAGKDLDTYAFVNYRYQWAGMDGAPRMATAGISGALGGQKINHLPGFAAMVSTFKWGTLQDNTISLAYSHLIAIKKGTYLRFGLSGALAQHSINRSMMRVENIDQDLVLASQYSNDISFSPGFGIAYDSKTLVFEASVPRLYDGQRENMFYTALAYTAYKLKVEPSNLLLMPSILFSYMHNSPYQVGVGMLGEYNEMFWGQLMYETSGDISAGIGLQLDAFRLGYNFELTNSVYSTATYGSHELMLAYRIAKNKFSDYYRRR
jgi:type IX secretion system PorP/SprF family membrane protein